MGNPSGSNDADSRTERPSSSQDVTMADLLNVKQEPEDREKCAVCLTYQISSRTGMDTCAHEFCHLCLKHWLKQAGTCPVCRQKPNTIIVNVRGADQHSYSLDELMKEKEEEERLQRGMAVPMTSEKEIINKRKHELNRTINELERSERRKGRGRNDRATEEQKRRHEEAVTERAGLQLLLDGIEEQSTTRQHVVSHPLFRALIYRFNCEWLPVDPNLNAHASSFTPRSARLDTEAQKERVIPFIMNELMIVPMISSKVNLMKAAVNRRRVADFVFSMCLDHQIHSPSFLRAIVGPYVGILRPVAERFQHELFEFASSQLTMEEHFKISAYRLPEGRHPNGGAFAVGGLAEPAEVVTLDDTVEPEPAEQVVISDDDEPIYMGMSRSENAGQNESNYLRDDPGSSGSDAADNNLFNRRACRLPAVAPSYHPTHIPLPSSSNPINFNDVFGFAGLSGGLPMPNMNMFGQMNSFSSALANLPRYQQVFPSSVPRMPYSEQPSTSRRSSGDVDVIEIDDTMPYRPRSPSYGSASPQEPYEPTSPPILADDDGSTSPNLSGIQLSSGSSTPRSSSSTPRRDEVASTSRDRETSSRRSSDRIRELERRADKYNRKLLKVHKEMRSIAPDPVRDRQATWLLKQFRMVRPGDSYARRPGSRGNYRNPQDHFHPYPARNHMSRRRDNDQNPNVRYGSNGGGGGRNRNFNNGY